ncbi:hypothetical protein EU642_21885 [Salmonella enterica]|nr:hypothetical protein [Salmonella enterica]EAO0118505.1 hypothetical protein [Salmonella enterica]EAO3601610.1 hypothetical protein [Salmonella enterica]EAR6391503.1 hypothetical protein [Salmonella enterica]EAV1285267.1 hypothetical protein [Salmonella enterica]
MTPIFRTPARYRWVALAVMALNIGNIVTFSSYFEFWADHHYYAQGVFVALFHFATILVLSMLAGRLETDGRTFSGFIRLMEQNGYVYLPESKEFKHGTKI